jgi:hypothetical protein
VEIVAILVADYSYEGLRALCGKNASAARKHGEQIVSLERALHLNHERAMQQIALHHVSFVQFLNFFYGNIHFVGPPLVLALWWRKSPEGYTKWRNRIVAATLIALVVFWLWPVAPPRLLPSAYGVVDTDALHGGLGILTDGVGHDLNVNAAMPSLHVGWALWCAAAGAALVRSRWAKAAMWLYPAFVFMTVTVTGNHFWLDAGGGVAVDLLGYTIGDKCTTLLGRYSVRRGARADSRQADDGETHDEHAGELSWGTQ